MSSRQSGVWRHGDAPPTCSHGFARVVWGNVRRVTLALASMLVSALLVGLLIGCVGIGGVLLPPALVYVGGLEFHLAAATSPRASLFCGAAGTACDCTRTDSGLRTA